jgi:pimeloyl-ACP methyl ester carboxylesterase
MASAAARWHLGASADSLCRIRNGVAVSEYSAGASEAVNQFADVPGRRLAYRQIGQGTPVVLCTRFRGTMDSWDPAFLDGLAGSGFEVTWFDYSGLGLSTGDRTYDPSALATDALDLMNALGLDNAVLAGWSVGGIAAQIALATASDRFTHLVLIATTPPGRLVKLAEPLFFELAARHNDADDEVALFFEPSSPQSRRLAKESRDRINQRTADRSPEVPFEWAASTLGPGPQDVMFPAEAVLDFERVTSVPILHVGGDHDIIFPVENWYALNDLLPTTQLLTYPSAGHGPQQQHPEAVAQYVATFVRTTVRTEPADVDA